MAAVDCDTDCRCRSCSLAISTGAAPTDAGSTDSHGNSTAANTARDAIPADSDEDGTGNSHACGGVAYRDASDATADINVAPPSHRRAPVGRSSRRGW